MNRVGIIGGGFGGIASAIRMRARGNDVVLYERLESLGGRAQIFKKNNYIHDAGPTVITAPNLFDELLNVGSSKLVIFGFSEKRIISEKSYISLMISNFENCNVRGVFLIGD